MTRTDQIDGVALGVILGFEAGAPLVVFAGNAQDHAIPARSLTALGAEDVGAEVALLFEEGCRDRPLIVGKLVEPPRQDRPPLVIRDGETVRVTATDRLELRVGKASIVMLADGRITIRGSYLTSHASAANRIRGGSVNLN
ncbi:DUF6484 domain-containing protein [Rhodovulum tesquicola]|uniref:DUF6484 domain-containing protein n=1 Tax=Rhodovulum tesquicola TaxID=540254 RepID=UPI0020975FFF|nr:DUF6484 domain-containing protein [Rhodovulum tesquicola]MCO8144948.1 DUF6484 domain-containing protein [Rhodovulum tesquicola]